MPTAFTTREREAIVQILLETGERLFTTAGLRKTSLDDLVGPAGIAKSSFYLFFASKEALYLELLARQADGVQRRVIDEGLLRGEGPRDALRRFLRATLTELAANPLYRRLMTHPDEMAAVARKIPPEQVAAAQGGAFARLREFVTTGQADGTLPPGDPDAVIGALRAVLLLPLHVEQIGEDLYPAVLDMMIDFVTTGLAPERTAS
ncbi:TetR/AcrR family transcriptional regulator [Streptosporangium sp. NPDC000396]|uniref:TetR/AcrR family transcriptional regulator n=1 Tax=Streptosporangium sp. NPDC000396 TaxID=3366185 RepID=UPI00367B1842